MKREKKKWYDYLWVLSLTYLILGFFNILFAWLGLLCFFIPLIISVLSGTKAYCNRYCGRGQLFSLLGGRFGLSRRRDVPKWMKGRAFRYGFLIFFLVMFLQMLWNTWLVFAGVSTLRQAVTLLWTFRLPWHWARHGTPVHPGVVQFAFGFYSVMLTSTVLGLPQGSRSFPFVIYASGFSISTIAAFCMGIRQFLLLPNSTITVSSVISMITP